MTDQEKLDLAMWALDGNRIWIGVTVERGIGKAEYVALYQPGVYSRPAIVPESHNSDPWVSLLVGKRWWDSQSDGGGEHGD